MCATSPVVDQPFIPLVQCSNRIHRTCAVRFDLALVAVISYNYGRSSGPGFANMMKGVGGGVPRFNQAEYLTWMPHPVVFRALAKKSLDSKVWRKAKANGGRIALWKPRLIAYKIVVGYMDAQSSSVEEPDCRFPTRNAALKHLWKEVQSDWVRADRLIYPPLF